MVWYGMVWYGMVWYGMVWYGMVWYGMVWYGMVCKDTSYCLVTPLIKIAGSISFPSRDSEQKQEEAV